MQQDENQKVATANVSPSEDGARMYRYHDSLRHQRADAGQRTAEDSEELHEAQTACVRE